MKNKIILIVIIILSITTSIFAHGGNITGWKDKESNKIIELNGKFYGYHNKDGIRHYHEVKWNDEKQKWEIVDANIYYDNNINVKPLEELSKNEQETEKVEVKFIEGIDGDTAKFDMNGEIIKVRFLAIDTPESVHPTKEVQAYGVEASNFTKQKLQNAQKIELEFDNNSDKKDKYDRYLSWVWVDGELLQDILVKEGLAKVAYLYADYKYTSVLQESEKESKEAKIGIWQDEIQENYSEVKENNLIENQNYEENNKTDFKEEILIILLLIVISFVFKVMRKNKKSN